MGDVGTLEWAARNGGRLSLREKLAQLREAVALQMRVLPAQVSWRVGRGRAGVLIDISEIVVPDSAAARRAEEHCREVSPEFLVNHCLRTYLWAQCLARPCGLRPDAELLWVASLLHDLGLTEPYAGGPSDAACFAVRGAEAARSVVAGTGWRQAQSDTLAEAIALHLNVTVDAAHGDEALLLNVATALDVTGLRLWELHEDTVRAIIERHPRAGMKREMTACWRREAREHPGTRAHFLSRWLRFESRIRGAPFAE